MPDPQPHPQTPQLRRVAFYTLLAGVGIMALKFTAFHYTNSAAVLTDALESIINLLAATMMNYTLWFANRPADQDHPYGHGKIEFMAVGLEGLMILGAGIFIFFEAIRRLLWPVKPTLGWQVWLVAGIGVLSAALAVYVLLAGRRYGSPTIRADGRHLLTDAASTAAVLVGLLVIRATGRPWLDPVIAMVIGAVILLTSWALLWQSVNGLLDRTDPRDQQAIKKILDEEVAAGHIRGYHKLRLRHAGTFHWVDLHLQVDPMLTVGQGHEIASRIEGRIEQLLGEADATAHVEPSEIALGPWNAGQPRNRRDAGGDGGAEKKG